MKSRIPFVLIDMADGAFAHPAAPQLDRGFSVWLSKTIDRLVLGLAVMAPPDGATLDPEYAEALVGVFDEWLALNGVKASMGDPDESSA